MTTPTMPVLFVSHGAATLTMDPTDPTHAWLRAYGHEVRALRPSAVLVCSAHDVRPSFTLGGADRVSMLNDHPTAVGRQWNAPGSPELAEAARSRVSALGLPAVVGRPASPRGLGAALAPVPRGGGARRHRVARHRR